MIDRGAGLAKARVSIIDGDTDNPVK